MNPVVVATPDVVGRCMAGPGIRAYSVARELSRHFPTTLVADLVDASVLEPSLKMVQSGSRDARRQIHSASVVFSQPTREVLGAIREDQKVIFDLFDPVPLELRELYGPRPTFRQRLHQFMEKRRIRTALDRGDLLVAAAPRQVDYFESLRPRQSRARRDQWVQMPFGCERFATRGTVPDDPPVVTWNGGIWEWLDPETAVRAIRHLNLTGTPCRLRFVAAKRPASAGPEESLGRALEEWAREAWIELEREWIPYAERGVWLARSKVAIMLHRRTGEAEFSVRTRLFDAIAAGVPVVASRGGYAAELVEKHGLGTVVAPGDAEGVAQAVRELIEDDEYHRRCVLSMGLLAEELRWDRVVRPIVEKIESWQGER